MTTMAEMWKNAVTLGNRIEDIYLSLKTGDLPHLGRDKKNKLRPIHRKFRQAI